MAEAVLLCGMDWEPLRSPGLLTGGPLSLLGLRMSAPEPRCAVQRRGGSSKHPGWLQCGERQEIPGGVSSAKLTCTSCSTLEKFSLDRSQHIGAWERGVCSQGATVH